MTENLQRLSSLLVKNEGLDLGKSQKGFSCQETIKFAFFEEAFWLQWKDDWGSWDLRQENKEAAAASFQNSPMVVQTKNGVVEGWGWEGEVGHFNSHLRPEAEQARPGHRLHVAAEEASWV